MLRRLAVVSLLVGTAANHAIAAPCAATGANLTLTNTTCQLSGVRSYDSVTLTNSTIEVTNFNGTDKIGTGNLELRAKTITIGAGSKITARGRGYQTLLCGNGNGPTATGGGRGGCSVRDSGGGGAHFGGGGRGTIDNPSGATFYEQDCSAAPTPAPTANGGNGVTVSYTMAGVAVCSVGGVSTPNSNCNGFLLNGTTPGTRDGIPTVAGQGYYHSIYQPEFGSSGGDKGCFDGDGKDPLDNTPATDLGLMVGGNGGGRIVLAGLDGGAGVVTINGTLDANGKRGCGIGNDSGGGGAGGTIFVVGDQVTIGATARISAAGGLGGDTQGQGPPAGSDPTGECVAPAQQGTTADDCGGGGGGGIVSVLSVTSTISDEAVFSVNGAAGGVSTACRGEAGGGVGELQISGGYVGEFCDGFDNDFDDQIDEGFADLACPGMSKPACFGGVPQQCTADVPACQGPVTDSRSRFAVILDTSGSMLGTLGGVPTFGDGSLDHPGRDHNANGLADDSRLFKAKTALNQVIAGYPNIDFALARYHQDTSLNRSCQLAHNFECNAICCSYDNPTGNTAPAPSPACSVNGGTSGSVVVLKNSPGDECVNYAGNCGPPRRGADVVVGFGTDINNHLMWLDGRETSYNASEIPGAFCDFAGGGDCELRGTGPTPLANSLQAVEDYLTPIKACDLASTGGCRQYGVILLTDGAESCQGNPVAAAIALQMKGIKTYVVGFSTLPSESAQLNAIAAAGGTTSAFLVGSDEALANALATIVSNSIVFETCNNLDDDCDTLIDEGFLKGGMCDNGQQGVCRATGTNVCRADGSGVECNAPPITPGTEPPNGCNNMDDDCDGKIDEGIVGCMCQAQGESCNNMDDDCDTLIDENLTRPCGTGVCQGLETCTGNNIWTGCTAPTAGVEICDGDDDDCDGIIDGFTEACSTLVDSFPDGDPRNNPGNTVCPAGQICPPTSVSPGCLLEGPAICLCHPGIKSCPTTGTGMFGACVGEVGPATEVCNGLDDDCDGVVDEGTAGADCSTNCGTGTTVCMNGTISCTSTTQPNDDTCDNNDDDCDGTIDEDYVSPGACGVGPPLTVCNGMERCIAGVETCIGDSIGTESCNCSDDDCDGQTDENVTCGGGASCISCQCASACAAGEFPCPLGKACSNGFCIEDPCFGKDCPPVAGNEQQCTTQGNAGVCVDSCSLVTCNTGLVCQDSTGDCVPDNCASFPDRCTPDQNCVVGVCVTNLCANVTCPTDQYCVGGQCFGSCAGIDCPAGERCRMGMCQADPCGTTCPFGQVCNDASGECGSNPCQNVLCSGGQWCDPAGNGQCTDDPCVGTTCPDLAQECRGGTCDDPPIASDAAEEHITTGGGGGCRTGGEGTGLAVLLVGLALLWQRRRVA